MKLKSSSCQLSTWNEFAIFFSKIQSSQLSSNLTQRMEPQQASYEFYWLLSTQRPWHRWSIYMIMFGLKPFAKIMRQIHDSHSLFSWLHLSHLSILSVSPGSGFHVHCTTTGCRRSNCRILSIPWHQTVEIRSHQKSPREFL